MTKNIIGTIYGPVGHVTQVPGQPPRIELPESKWIYFEALINQRIAGGSAFVGVDRVPRVLDVEVSAQDLESLSCVLNDQSDDELFIIADEHVPSH